ncbi:MAG: glycosyltransferase [Desulfotomaculaceae bacterium]|nr:glycosyltransferase [Desulfotomaculaceae bacterium]
MDKIVFLFNSAPLPRIKKRMKVALKIYEVIIIYWDRLLAHNFEAGLNKGIHEIKLTIKAPQGKTLQRVLPLVVFLLRALGKVLKISPNVIHAANFDMLLVACVYRLWKPSVRIIYEVADLPKFQQIMFFEKILGRMVDRLILTSEYHYEAYYQKIFSKDQVIILPNCPEKETFAHFSRKLPDEDLTIGLIGSLRYFEQVSMLIEAVKALKGVKILIAGAGPDYQKVYARVLGLESVEFYGPYDYERDIVQLYSRVDCLYSVYNADLLNVRYALPNRLYEAIACSLPIIVAAGTRLSSFVDLYQIGFSVSHKDAGQLIKLLAELKAKRVMLEEKSKNCSLIREQYNYEADETKLADMYRELQH